MATPPSPEIQERLEALARETGRSVAQLAREALFEHIDAIEDYYRSGGGKHGKTAAPYGTEPDLDLGL